MRATIPHVQVPGDRDDRIMARAGTCVGMSDELAVWRFGFLTNSPSAVAHGVHVNEFLWVLATRRVGKVKDQWLGAAVSLPAKYRKVLEWEPTQE